MCELIICRGIPASGKSTWSKQWVSEDPTCRIRYNWDDLRNMMGPYWVKEREGTSFLKENRDMFLKFWMNKGWDIVVDNMNLNPKDISYYNELISKHNEQSEFKYEIKFKDFFIEVEECIRRDKLRPNPIGEYTIRSIWKKYRDTIWNIVNRKLYHTLHKQNELLPHCILVDLDGTVALNLSGRPYYGEGCKEGLKTDEPIIPIINLIENYKGKVVFFTGRDESVKEETKEWINSHINIKDYELIMRPLYDYSDGAVCKAILYKDFIYNRYYVDFVLEDSDKIVKTLRELGLFVLQPN